MYGAFTWWTGVVEDRVDPLKLGRCRVRILGYHTDKKDINNIPTSTLPWATPSQPITSAAMSGIGSTPMGPVEGTWVFGFFRDGKNAQDPVMIGTFGGIAEEGPNPSLGFNDPKGKYPQLETETKEGSNKGKLIPEPDTNKLARGTGSMPLGTKNGENSPSLQWKRKSRQKDVPVAVAKDMSTASGGDTIANTGNTALYGKANWFEPNPRYGGATTDDTKYYKEIGIYNKTTGKLVPEDGLISSQYPYNHVRQSESGHVEEWDDTPTAERLHRYHKTGTFEEIQPDGTRVTKVVGNEYEITLGLKDVLIQGACNVTVKGDCRMLYQGDLVQEVYGDYHLNVHKDKRSFINGNEVTEVKTDRKTVINGEEDLFVGKNKIINIAGNLSHNVGGTMDEAVTGTVSEIYLTSWSNTTSLSTLIIAGVNIDISSMLNLGMSAGGFLNIYSTGPQIQQSASTYTQITGALHTVTVGGAMLTTVSGLYKVTAPLILLN